MARGRAKAKRLAYAGQVGATGAVVVPDLLGLTVSEARRAVPARVVIGGGTGLASPEESEPVVVRQSPEAGRALGADGTVTVWLADGPGDAGVREPRRPLPTLLDRRAVADPADETETEEP